jgi:hypothetical protein
MGDTLRSANAPDPTEICDVDEAGRPRSPQGDPRIVE